MKSFILSLLIPFGNVIYLDSEIQKGESIEINRPPSTYRTLVRWKNIKKTACLIYKIPSPKTTGSLYFRDFENKDCSLGTLENSDILFSGLNSLEVRDIKLERNPSFEIKIKDSKESKTFRVHLPFYSSVHARWKGIEIFEPPEKKDLIPDGEVCVSYDKNCREIVEKSCERCASKTFSAFSNLNCPSKVYGICGLDQCGGKGQYACLKMNALVPSLECVDVEKHFFCQHGSTLECSTQGKVICR
ncbi:MAG: hypothetical protein NXH75_12795 [Halobacteriovoraceae bacterium]|nr:hypothetical protein [Halobacteriovoraceae bacterium]